MLEEDDGGAVVAGALAEAHEALLDVLAAAARRPVEVHHHQRARGPGPIQVPPELLVRLELRHAVHRAELVVVVLHGGKAREGPVGAPSRFFLAAAALGRGGGQAAAVAAKSDSWEGDRGGRRGAVGGAGGGGGVEGEAAEGEQRQR